MAIITLDVAPVASSSHDLINGYDFERVAIVANILPTDTINYNSPGGALPLPIGVITSTDYLIWAAEQLLIDAPDPGGNPNTGTVGDRGSTYQIAGAGPGSGINVFLKAFHHEIINENTVKIIIVYRAYQILTWEIEGALGSRHSSLDINGNPVIVSFNQSGLVLTQPKFVELDEAMPIFTVRFVVTAGAFTGGMVRGFNCNLQTGSSAFQIMTALALYRGCVNNQNYSIGVITATPHQLKCVKVTGISRDNGITFDASMSFQFRQGAFVSRNNSSGGVVVPNNGTNGLYDGWDERVDFIDRSVTENPTGEPIAGLIYSNVLVGDAGFPQYAAASDAGTDGPGIGSTIAATVQEAQFPTFGGGWLTPGGQSTQAAAPNQDATNFPNMSN